MAEINKVILMISQHRRICSIFIILGTWWKERNANVCKEPEAHLLSIVLLYRTFCDKYSQFCDRLHDKFIANRCALSTGKGRPFFVFEIYLVAFCVLL